MFNASKEIIPKSAVERQKSWIPCVEKWLSTLMQFQSIIFTNSNWLTRDIGKARHSLHTNEFQKTDQPISTHIKILDPN